MAGNVDIDLLRAFVAVHETGGFSHAAAHLGRTQSTVSQQIKKLEEVLGRRVFTRTNRQVELSTDGEVLLDYAQKILHLNDEVVSRLVHPDIRGAVRLGTPEAFAATHLPNVLAQFARSYPSVSLEVNCDLTENLLQGFEGSRYDLVLIKWDKENSGTGRRIWHESLVWVTTDKDLLKPSRPVPLVLSPSPCIYRKKALQALEKAGRKWRAAYTSHSLAGRIAAVKAGLGVAVMPKELVQPGFFVVESKKYLPRLEEIEIALIENILDEDSAVHRLAEHITFCLESEAGKMPLNETRLAFA